MKLKFGNGFLDPNDQRPMRSLDPLGSQLVALRAVPSDAPVKRNPLQVATPQSTNSRVPSIDRGTISRSTSKSHSNSIPLFPDLQSWTPGGAQDENRPPSHSSYVSSSTYTPPPAPSHTLARLDAASQPLQHAETPRGDSGVTQSPSLAQLSRTPSSTASTGMRDQNASANNADDVRSLKLKNRFLNIAFQRYLTEFYETTKATTGHYSAPYVYDLAWDAWSRLPPKELESYIAKGTRVAQGMPEWSDLETMKEMLQNVKPELAEESKGPMEDDSQEIKPELDFKEQFGEVEQPPSQSEVVQRQSFQLQEFTANVTLDILEASVQRGLQYLEDLKKPLVAKLDVSPDAANWVKSIENLQKSATKVRTVIGVVGSTGAGKSSVINAMLDEERLLPTNTMRACTAVVTELSYNSDDRAYRAEIEFISEDDWRKELTILFQDLVAEDGTVSKDCTDPDSEAGVAYAKIRAVYHKKTKEDIGKGSDVESLLKEVSHILGKTEVIRQNDSLMFYRRLQHFIDSKEKSTGRDKKDKTERVMEMWPLIKVVRIYVKSPALLTGAVIVDLPGVHDANAARAAVADGYMKQCTGLWIVAPIIRAVDDKSAKKLLGESFKRQLKMDGGYNAVSFICSKTDDISLTEASDSLGLDDVNAPRWKEIDECDDKQKALKKELDQHTETQGDYFAAMEECDIQIDAWDALLQKVEDGKTVYPLTEGKKRKRGGRYKSNKRQKSTTDSDDDFIDDSSVHAESDEEEDGDDDADDLELDHPEPLTKEDITAKLAEIKETKKEARKHRAELTATVKATKNAMVKVKETRAKIESEISRVCIEGRNDYSRGAIKVDFAAGIKELDQVRLYMTMPPRYSAPF